MGEIRPNRKKVACSSTTRNGTLQKKKGAYFMSRSCSCCFWTSRRGDTSFGQISFAQNSFAQILFEQNCLRKPCLRKIWLRKTKLRKPYLRKTLFEQRYMSLRNIAQIFCWNRTIFPFSFEKTPFTYQMYINIVFTKDLSTTSSKLAFRAISCRYCVGNNSYRDPTIFFIKVSLLRDRQY